MPIIASTHCVTTQPLRSSWGLEPIQGRHWAKAAYTLNWSSDDRRATKTERQPFMLNSEHVFSLREESRLPCENPCMLKKNKLTPHRKALTEMGFEPAILAIVAGVIF